MSYLVDARGLHCPDPVIRTKKALESESLIEVLVDNDTALENVKRLAATSGCKVNYAKESDGSYRIVISRDDESGNDQVLTGRGEIRGETIVVLESDTMGSGDDELGAILITAFLHTLTEISPVPDKVILYNSGVKLAMKGTQSADDLNILAGSGTHVLVCGTCVNHFEIKDKIAAGTISNMYDIAGSMMKAGRTVCP